MFIRPILEYGSVLFDNFTCADNCSSAMVDMTENVQRQAALTVTGAYTNTSHTSITGIRAFSSKS